jgi:hypothetical protein
MTSFLLKIRFAKKFAKLQSDKNGMPCLFWKMMTSENRKQKMANFLRRLRNIRIDKNGSHSRFTTYCRTFLGALPVTATSWLLTRTLSRPTRRPVPLTRALTCTTGSTRYREGTLLILYYCLVLGTITCVQTSMFCIQYVI